MGSPQRTGICWSLSCQLPFIGWHILSAANLQGRCQPPTRRSRLRRLSRVHLSLCSTRYVWRRHPQLPMVELNFISLYWPSLPNGIQAAYEDFDRDLIFIFKGNCLRFSSSFSSWWRKGRTPLCSFRVQRGESRRECWRWQQRFVRETWVGSPVHHQLLCELEPGCTLFRH